MKCLPDPEQPGHWCLHFNEFEGEMVASSFQRLAKHYQLEMDELPESLQDYWRGRIGAGRDIDSLPEEQQHLEEERLAWRSERFPLVEKWLADYVESGLGEPWILRLDRESLESLIIIVNDRRLTIAAEHELDDTLMEADVDTITDIPLRQALWEVHVLAYVQEYCLAAIHAEPNPETTNEP